MKKRLNITRKKLKEIFKMDSIFKFGTYVEVIDENGNNINVIEATEDEEYICLDDEEINENIDEVATVETATTSHEKNVQIIELFNEFLLKNKIVKEIDLRENHYTGNPEAWLTTKVIHAVKEILSKGKEYISKMNIDRKHIVYVFGEFEKTYRNNEIKQVKISIRNISLFNKEGDLIDNIKVNQPFIFWHDDIE